MVFMFMPKAVVSLRLKTEKRLRQKRLAVI